MQTATQAADIQRGPGFPQNPRAHPEQRRRLGGLHVWNSSPGKVIRPNRNSVSSLEIAAQINTIPAEQQHQILTVLAPILKRLKLTAGLDLRPGLPVCDALTQVARIIEAQIGQHAWTVTENDLRFRYLYDEIDEIVWMPLDWLPQLEALNKTLHNLALRTLALFQEKTGIGFDVDMTLEWFKEKLDDPEDYGLDKEDISILVDSVNDYENGVAARYLKLINEDQVPLEPLQKHLREFEPVNEWETEVLHWIEKGMDLALTGSLYKFVDEEFIDDEYPEAPHPADYIWFMWSIEDHMGEEIYDHLNSSFQQMGEVAPLSHTAIVTATEGEIPPHTPQWPYRMKEWFIRGQKIDELVTITWRDR